MVILTIKIDTILIYIVVLFISMNFFGCDDFGNKINKSDENYKIEYDINDKFIEFINLVSNYAQSFNDNLELSEIRLNYNSEDVLNIEFIYFHDVSDDRAYGLVLSYNESKGAIIYSIYGKGHPKALAAEMNLSPPYDDFDTSKWSLSFNEAKSIILDKVSTKNSCKIKSIKCTCQSDFWLYHITFFDDTFVEYKLNPTTGETALY